MTWLGFGGAYARCLGSPDPISVWLWAGLFIIALPLLAGFGFRGLLPAPVLFAGVTCVVAVPAYAVFLRVLSYYTQPWYYITLTILVASAFDVIFGAWRDGATASRILRGLRLIVAVALICLAALPAWEEMPIRHTNVDLVADKLRSDATKDDLIVTSHWQYAVSLYRYYHGPAEVITLPPIDDHRFHRYDLALRQMRTAEPLQPAYARMEEVLRGGHKVFVVGGLPPPKPGVPPPDVSLGYREARRQLARRKLRCGLAGFSRLFRSISREALHTSPGARAQPRARATIRASRAQCGRRVAIID